MLLDRLGLRRKGCLRGRIALMAASLHETESDSRRLVDGFRRRIVTGFLGLSALYGVYAVGAFFALDPGASVSYRLVLVFGTATFPLTVLVAPAVFVASMGDSDRQGASDTGFGPRHWWLIALVALGAGLASAVGPIVFDYALAGTEDFDHVRLPQEGMISGANARLVVPPALVLFVVVAALAGAIVGRLTTAFTEAPRVFARSAAGVLLVAVFWTTMVVVAELITMHGILSPIWLALAPPLVPFLLTCALARDDCARIVRSLVDRIRHRQERMEPLVLDGLVTAVQQADDPDPSAAGVRARDHPDPGMAELLARLHRLEGPRGAGDEARVNAIVQALTAVPPPVASDAPQQANAPPTSHRLQIAAAAVGCWACLSSALLLLGGAAVEPPTIASASVAGVFGAWATVHIARRDKANALSSAPV